MTAELDKLVIADTQEQEENYREQMQKEDAQRLDAELAAYEQRINALMAKEDQQPLDEQVEQVEVRPSA